MVEHWDVLLAVPMVLDLGPLSAVVKEQWSALQTAGYSERGLDNWRAVEMVATTVRPKAAQTEQQWAV